MSSPSKYYFPQLDAIRGLSFLAVFFFHAFHPQFDSGFLGRMLQYFYNDLFLSIDVFFILSSFLLTWLGINEYKVKGNFSFINYFIRRALRIWPLYYILMIFSFLLLPYVATRLNVPVTLPPSSYYIFFVSNFYLEGHVYFLRFLWTLSVEEQFYLVWGLCMLLLQRHIVGCVLVFLGVSIAYTVYAITHQVHYDYHTLTYLFDFAVGILAAFILQKGKWIVPFFKNISIKKALVFFMSLPLIFVSLFLITDCSPAYVAPWTDLLGRYIFIIYVALFIIEQMVNERSLLPLRSNRVLIYTGKISYGLYCFHGIVLTFGAVVLQKLHLVLPHILQAFLFLLINFIIASVSYRFIESPFLRLKDKLRRI